MLGGKHYNYEHVLAKTRGLFSYQSNSLEKENRGPENVVAGLADTMLSKVRRYDIEDKKMKIILSGNQLEQQWPTEADCWCWCGHSAE